MSGFDFTYKNFWTPLDFSSAAADLHEWKIESDTVSVLNNRKATFYLAGMLLLRKIMIN